MSLPGSSITRIRSSEFDVTTTSTRDVELFDLRNVHDNLYCQTTPPPLPLVLVFVSNFAMKKIFLKLYNRTGVYKLLTTAQTHKE